MDEDLHPRPTLRQQRQENVLKEREEALKHRDTSLKYGHLGAPYYNVEQELWQFTRRLSPAPLFKPAGKFEIVVPSPIRSLAKHGPVPSWDLSKSSDLVSVYPGVPLATDLLVREERLSKSITSAAIHYEPTLLNRFASGYANVSYDAFDRAVQIVAYVTGESGDQVKFVSTHMVGLAWSKTSDSTLQVEEILGPESLWYGHGAPVQQIKSVLGAEKNEAWLAVQLATSTTVFHPRHYRQPLPPSAIRSGTTDSREPASKIHANPLATIEITQTGGFAHADVSFNPWFPQQLAIIDRQMNWSIWEMKYKHALHPHAINTLSGNVGSDFDESFEEAALHTVDGWARVCWIAVDKLAVCQRRRLCVYHIRGHVAKMPISGLDFLQESEWILDIGSIPAAPEIFLLTSLRVIWVRIKLPAVDNEGEEAGALAEILLSWRHFRSDDDVSLTLEVQGGEESTLLLIYSRLNPLASLYRFSSISASSPIPLSLSNPSRLTVLMDSPNIRISTLTFRRLAYHSLSDDIGAQYESMGIEFYKLTTLASDLSVRECFYTARNISDSTDRSLVLDEGIRLPSIRKYRVGKNPRFAVKSEQRIRDEFVTGNDEVDIFLPTGSLTRPGLFAARRKSSLREIRNGWTVDYELLYDTVTGTRDNGSQHRSLESSVEALRHLLESIESSFSTLCTVRELLEAVPQIDDIEVASTKFELLINTETDSTQRLVEVGLTKLWPSDADDRANEANLQTLSSINCSLVQSYLNSLHGDIPDQARKAKTKVLSKIAINLFQAGIALRPQTAGPAPAGRPMTATRLPEQGKGKAEALGRTNSPDRLSSPPFPSSQATLLSESQDLQVTDEDSEDSACFRLRAYTTVKALPPLTRSMSNILIHWTDGQDPQLYDWKNTEALLAQPSAEERAAQELQAKKNQRRRKQQLMDEPGRLARVSDEHAPTRRVVASQSQPMTILASSQVMGDLTSASQTGKAKKAKKKKIAGFK